MSLKLEFVDRAREDGANVSALCREFGISRQTGHKWLKRYEQEGHDGLDERSRRPNTSPLAKGELVVLAIVEAREAHPRWGSRKLAVLLRRRFGKEAPSDRTIARVLERFGKLRKRRERRRLSVVEVPPQPSVHGVNDLWTVDFKGWWRTADGGHCEPLTVRDAFSRFVLAVTLLDNRTTLAVREVFEQLFKRYGLPKAIQCDNGSPFASVASRGGLTQLSAWWFSLGVQLVRSRPGCPQDNGAHERMHADMSADLEAFPEESLADQQRACDRWRKEFNEIRPHDALGGRTPAEFYSPSPRRPRLRTAVYPPGWIVRLVARAGTIKINSNTYVVSGALQGHCVGLEPMDGLRWRLWFHDMDLGPLEVVPTDLPLVDRQRLRRSARISPAMETSQP